MSLLQMSVQRRSWHRTLMASNPYTFHPLSSLSCAASAESEHESAQSVQQAQSQQPRLSSSNSRLADQQAMIAAVLMDIYEQQLRLISPGRYFRHPSHIDPADSRSCSVRLELPLTSTIPVRLESRESHAAQCCCNDGGAPCLEMVELR
jgi:hypothetical protein